MSQVVDQLYIALNLDPSKLDKGLAQAQSKLATGMKSIMSTVFAPLMAGLGGLSVGALFSSIKDELSQMNSLSKAYRVNIEDMTAWSRAITMSGGNVESFSNTLGFLNQNLTRMALTGHSRVKPFFEAMGLDAQKLAKKPVLNALEEISVAIEGMDKRQSANLLRGMGFDAGSIKLLQSGTKNVKELIARQKELGVYTAKDAEALAKMNKGFKEIVSVLKTALIPIFTKVISVASRVTQYLVSASLLIRKNLKAIEVVAIALAFVFRTQLKKAFLEFVTALATSPLTAFMVALTGLFLIFDDLIVYAKGGKSALKGFWKNFGSPKEVQQGLDNIAKKIGEVFKFLGGLNTGNLKPFLLLGAILGVTAGAITAFLIAIGWIPIAIGVAVGLIVAYWDKIEKAFKELKQNIKAVPDVIIGAFKLIGKMIASVFSGLVGAIDSFLAWVKSGVNGIFSSLIEVGQSVDSAFSNAIDVITGLWDGLVESFNSGCSAIGNFFSSAADTARSAWASFLDWLEQKWNWLKDLLPSFSKAASFISKGDVAVAGGGGNVSNVTTNDNSVHNTTKHYYTRQAVEADNRRSNVVPNANTGVRR